MGLNSAKKSIDLNNDAMKIRESDLAKEAEFLKSADGVVRENTGFLRYDKLMPYAHNRDATINLDYLADSIEHIGLLTPLRVTHKTFGGKHIIIAGERRYNAIALLREKYPGEEKYEILPVEYSAAETEEKIAEEVFAENDGRENLSIKDTSKIFSYLIDLYDKKIQNGEAVDEGRKEFIKERFQQLTGVGNRQYRRYMAIEFTAIDDVKEMVEAGLFTKKQGEAISGADKEVQELIVEMRNAGNSLDEETIRNMKKLSEENMNLLKKLQIQENRLKIYEATLSNSGASEAEKKENEKQISEIKKQRKELINNLGTDHTAIKKLFDSAEKSIDKVMKADGIIITATEFDRIDVLIKKLQRLKEKSIERRSQSHKEQSEE